MATTFNERTWLEWLVKVRIIIITFLLAIEIAITTLTVTNVNKGLFVTVILAWYATSIFYIGWLRFGDALRLQSKAQILTDLAFATVVIYVTGGIDTSFNFLYPLIIILASILLSQTWAYLTAALSFILFGAILELTFFDLIHAYSVTHTDLKSLQAVIFINLFAYITIAYLAGRLSTRLRQADVELQERSDALEDLQALHAHIVNSISGGLITTDLNGRIQLVNPAARIMLGARGQRLEGTSIQDLFADLLPSVGGSLQRREVRSISRSGERIFAVTVSALNISDRGIIGLVYTFDDLTEIRRLEREIRMRERLAAIGRLAAGIAHEIRNPLSSIAGSVKVLSGISALSDDQRKLVEIVTRESDRLNSIITDFLDYSREKRFQMRAVDLVSLLQDTVMLLENRPPALRRWHEGEMKLSPKCSIRRSFDVESAPAVGDEDKLKQVFWNIAENAFRAMPNGGTLEVSLRAEQNWWRIAFTDTGEGILPQQMEKIFEPFQSSFAGGTGLGLAIVYQIVQAHDAKISVSSEPGSGTEFVLRFSRATEGKRQAASAAV